LGAKVMKKELNYFASKRWGKVGHEELFKQEIDPRWGLQSIIDAILCQ
jgi:hypothetical protein